MQNVMGKGIMKLDELRALASARTKGKWLVENYPLELKGDYLDEDKQARQFIAIAAATYDRLLDLWEAVSERQKCNDEIARLEFETPDEVCDALVDKRNVASMRITQTLKALENL